MNTIKKITAVLGFAAIAALPASAQINDSRTELLVDAAWLMQNINNPGLMVICHIGLWASAVVFAARTLGIDARLYDGSMTEWANRAELPLVMEGGGN